MKLKKYSGQYVAIRSFTDRDVIAHGNDLVKVTEEAKSKGVKEPVVFYVPEEGVGSCYEYA